LIRPGFKKTRSTAFTEPLLRVFAFLAGPEMDNPNNLRYISQVVLF